MIELLLLGPLALVIAIITAAHTVYVAYAHPSNAYNRLRELVIIFVGTTLFATTLFSGSLDQSGFIIALALISIISVHVLRFAQGGFHWKRGYLLYNIFALIIGISLLTTSLSLFRASPHNPLFLALSAIGLIMTVVHVTKLVIRKPY